MVADYTRRRDILVDGLNAIPGITCKKSAGSFYAFPNIKAFGKTSQAFAEELLENAGVVTCPALPSVTWARAICGWYSPTPTKT